MKRFLTNLLLLLVLAVALAIWVKLPWPGVLALAVLFALWMLASRRGRQAASVAAVGLSTLRQRLGSAAVIVIGIAGVVAVLVALLAMGEGYSQTLRKTGSADTAIVMRGASASEVMSVLDHDSVTQVVQTPGIVRDAKGQPLASPELVVAANLPIIGGGADDEGSVQLRGVGEQAWAVRPQVKIVSGRRFNPGMRELNVGVGAARQFAGLAPGREVRLGSQLWTVVGVFASGDALDSEVWGDANVVADTYRRGSSRASVVAKLADPQAFGAFKAALEANPQLKIDADTTRDYYANQSEGMSKVIRVMGITVGLIMAIGAMFGALNTMFAAVAARAREIATLRAIGFRGLPVVVAVMLETMLLALLGGVIGGALAWLVFNGYGASTLAAGTVGKLSFELAVTPALLGTGLKWALAIGFVGGLFPAVRAARLPVTTALRES
ncbi:ABC transporter permease [Rhodanobacter denitrificans]|uniref:ABC-type transport system, involved in lipoprotein release, permease component n=1 Tax=Rhodanobacter denitrificans TaxID=666685 RepID=M4NS67_9GAMM|nr:ABC transporter permease [Rhodanobacter denitrificans]AGG90386.1 ABC-type transport system, involved in lipoprotein release, permease component [Rhodanobacter denitrificans]UJJ57334.1 ABC transporter permease [Rhodanobacter denitrificans]UJM85772.1 ABC transporter permease [Rhodanobacter denitrificans]